MSDLPPLPEPWGHYPKHLQVACYTTNQMREYALAAIAAERSKWIKVVNYVLDYNEQAESIIRAVTE